jgi:hypothetical protein
LLTWLSLKAISFNLRQKVVSGKPTTSALPSVTQLRTVWLMSLSTHTCLLLGCTASKYLLKADSSNIGQLTPSAFDAGDQIVGQAAAARTGAGFVDVIVGGISGAIAS